MKLTNLQYVQSILSSLGSDEVNSVSDTTESLQVLECLRTTYFNIISRTDLPEQTQIIQLDSSLDNTIPVIMYVPAGVGQISWIRYYDSNNLPDTDGTNHIHDLNLDVTSSGGTISSPPPGYKYVNILPFQDFIEYTQGFNPENTEVSTFTFTDTKNNFPGTYTFYYRTDRTPTYCTVLSDYYVIFDSYDSVVDSTLQSSKTMCSAEIIPAWSNDDSFIPNIDETQVPLLLNEAKSLAFYELKQMLHQKAEQESKRQWSSVQKDKSLVNRPTYFDALPDFGRRGRLAGTSYFKRMGWDRP